MTNKQAYAGLLERLRGLIPISSVTGHSDFGLVNPDGPEAAEAISSLLKALKEQTRLVDRLCTAVDLAAEDIGHENIENLLGLIAPQNERCIELIGGRAALNSDVPLSIGEGL